MKRLVRDNKLLNRKQNIYERFRKFVYKSITYIGYHYHVTLGEYEKVTKVAIWYVKFLENCMLFFILTGSSYLSLRTMH